MSATPLSAILLLSHGSRDPRAEYVVAELVSAVAAGTGGTVRAAHLGFTAPTPVVALRQLAAEGFTSARVVPLLFTSGFHLTHDVPQAVAASGVTEQMEVSVAPPLLTGEGRQRRLLLTALADRLLQAGVGAGARIRVDGLVLASAGSSAQQARAIVESLARDLQEAHGLPVISAFAAGACVGASSPAQALEALSSRGVRRPAVASLFVAPGRLTDTVVARCPGVPVADPLGVSPSFVELLVTNARALSRAR